MAFPSYKANTSQANPTKSRKLRRESSQGFVSIYKSYFLQPCWIEQMPKNNSNQMTVQFVLLYFPLNINKTMYIKKWIPQKKPTRRQPGWITSEKSPNQSVSTPENELPTPNQLQLPNKNRPC